MLLDEFIAGFVVFIAYPNDKGLCGSQHNIDKYVISDVQM